ELHGWGDLQTELNTLSKRGEWVTMGELIDDEVLEAFAVVCPIDQVAAKVKARVGDASALRRRQTTTLTSRGGRVMTRCGTRPARASVTLGEARAAASASDSAMSGGTSILSRSLPLSCTTIVTVSS